MLCTLESLGIPAFVQGNGFGSLYPGPQIASYNSRRIMVPDAYAAQGKEALSVFAQPLESSAPESPSFLNKLRVVLELVIFGWFVPGNRRRAAAASNTSSKRTRKEPRAD
jgi:hypothetical protein